MISFLPRLWRVSVRTMSSMASPSIPRPSSSVIIVNHLNEVLLVHRAPTTTAFAGFHAFPGGNLDSSQDTSPEMTAIRETFEETGVLLASTASGGVSQDAASILAARTAVHAQQVPFPRFLQQANLIANTSVLLPFTQWTTPPHIPRKFFSLIHVLDIT
jgi:8-oxo-dGTP pyrophosphatase MutT (NUDIX family)